MNMRALQEGDINVERFWSHVDQSEDCWEWTGARADGYGMFGVHRRMYGAHRVSYVLAHGMMPSGLVIDHICHNRVCVNPDHLRAVTSKQNNEHLQGARKGNRSGALGVSWHSVSKKWMARVTHNRRHIYVGIFSTIAEAEAAAIAKRNELFTHNDADRVATSKGSN